MTTPKEALERIAVRSIAQDDDDEKELRRQLYHIEALAKSALASIEGDAVERVARIIDPNAGWGVKLDSDYIDLRHEQARLADKQRIAITKARAILATGLVPDEAAIRANQRPLGDVFNELVRRMNFDGMDPRTFTLGELERAIDGAEFPK